MRNSPVTITPRMAKKWLAKNSKNRPLSERTVAYYADMMRRGLWVLNGDTIRFDEDGTLIDGQHRLAAVVMSNTSIQSYVINDLPKAAFFTIDEGKPRSFSDRLASWNEKNYTTLGGALSNLLRLRDATYNLPNPKTNPRDLKALLDKHPGIREAVAESMGSKVLRAAMQASFRYVFGLIDAERAKLFFERLEEGVGLTKDMPEYQLRQVLLTRLSHGAKLDMRQLAAFVIKAWNAAFTNQPLKLLKFQEAEAFPVIINCPPAFQVVKAKQQKKKAG
jgi:hypothetical protein